MEKILILGSSGYIGNALMQYLDGKYDIKGVDNNSREFLVNNIGSESLTPVIRHPKTIELDIRNYDDIEEVIRDFRPSTIVHLAEQPSAPWSMKDVSSACNTQTNNIVGTLNVMWAIKKLNPNIHLIKLGTAGEYPDWLYNNVKIPESDKIVVRYDDTNWTIPTPRSAGSFYHFSKLFDSLNLEYGSRIWGLNITDINQAPVWGYINGTRFDYDFWFGTIINRFAVQKAIGMPLTIYGTGDQQRGFIHIQNALEAIELVISHPPDGFRIIHQLTEVKTINEIADLIGGDKQYIKNPRVEMPTNRFNFEMKILKDWGLKPIYMKDKIGELLETVEKYKNSVRTDVIMGDTKW